MKERGACLKATHLLSTLFGLRFGGPFLQVPSFIFSAFRGLALPQGAD